MTVMKKTIVGHQFLGSPKLSFFFYLSIHRGHVLKSIGFKHVVGYREFFS